jgi:uncharacterized protein (DUF1778 family)
MAREAASPVSFRLNPDDRQLVETVAAYRNQTLSDFVRSVVIEAAETIVQAEGKDKILRALEESNDRLSEQRRELYRQAVDHATPSR